MYLAYSLVELHTRHDYSTAIAPKNPTRPTAIPGTCVAAAQADELLEDVAAGASSEDEVEVSVDVDVPEPDEDADEEPYSALASR